MITEIKEYEDEEEKEREISELLSKDFNRVAKEKKSRYRIKILYGQYPNLVYWIFQRIQINYNVYKDEFNFIGGIDKKTFEKIKEILESIKQKFLIELNETKEI